MFGVFDARKNRFQMFHFSWNWNKAERVPAAGTMGEGERKLRARPFSHFRKFSCSLRFFKTVKTAILERGRKVYPIHSHRIIPFSHINMAWTTAEMVVLSIPQHQEGTHSFLSRSDVRYCSREHGQLLRILREGKKPWNVFGLFFNRSFRGTGNLWMSYYELFH